LIGPNAFSAAFIIGSVFKDIPGGIAPLLGSD
jgi:hypothetical protein